MCSSLLRKQGSDPFTHHIQKIHSSVLFWAKKRNIRENYPCLLCHDMIYLLIKKYVFGLVVRQPGHLTMETSGRLAPPFLKYCCLICTCTGGVHMYAPWGYKISACIYWMIAWILYCVYPQDENLYLSCSAHTGAWFVTGWVHILYLLGLQLYSPRNCGMQR